LFDIVKLLLSKDFDKTVRVSSEVKDKNLFGRYYYNCDEAL